MKQVLIVGPNSYLGSSLGAYLARFPESYQVSTLSVRDDRWRETPLSAFDAIYYTAALVHREQAKNDPSQAKRYDEINAVLPAAVAQKAKAEGVRQFVFLSTMAVYGLTAPYGKTVTITAQTPLCPTDYYGQSKAKAERKLLALEDDSFRVAILRPPMIYGKGCKGNYQALRAFAQKMPCFPKIGNGRSMLYVGNLNRLVQLLLDSGEGGIFCPQDGEYVDTGSMVQAIARAQGRSLPLIPGFGWALSLLRHASPKIDKAFGSLRYDQTLSSFSQDYRVFSWEQAVRESED